MKTLLTLALFIGSWAAMANSGVLTHTCTDSDGATLKLYINEEFFCAEAGEGDAAVVADKQIIFGKMINNGEAFSTTLYGRSFTISNLWKENPVLKMQEAGSPEVVSPLSCKVITWEFDC